MFILTLVAGLGVLLTMVSGAVLTYAFANSLPLAPVGIFSVLGHRFIAEGAGTLVVLLALWITFGGQPARVKILGWIAVALVAAEALIGRVSAPLSAGLGFLHAVFAQLIIAMLAHIVIYTWSGWKKEAVPVPNTGRLSLTGMANYAVGALLLQVTLGAAYRHGLLSVVWHILGAFIVVIFALGIVVTATQVPANQPLKPPAIWLVVLLGVQVTLGMILISISTPPEHPTFASIIVATHVLVGSSALATGVINSLLVRRSVRAAAAAS